MAGRPARTPISPFPPLDLRFPPTALPRMPLTLRQLNVRGCFMHGNVKAFGAVGDGKSDDTIALRRATNSRATKTLYFPGEAPAALPCPAPPRPALPRATAYVPLERVLQPLAGGQEPAGRRSMHRHSFLPQHGEEGWPASRGEGALLVSKRRGRRALLPCSSPSNKLTTSQAAAPLALACALQWAFTASPTASPSPRPSSWVRGSLTPQLHAPHEFPPTCQGPALLLTCNVLPHTLCLPAYRPACLSACLFKLGLLGGPYLA